MVYIKQVGNPQSTQSDLVCVAKYQTMSKMTQVVPINPHLIQLMENALDDLLTWNDLSTDKEKYSFEMWEQT